MKLTDILAQLTEEAKDLRLNLDSLLSPAGHTGLSPTQTAVVALASAMASRYAPLTQSVAQWAAEQAPEDALRGARVASAIMGMNNVYYRFVHLVGDAEYETLRAGLRMNAMSRPGGDPVDFELACLAISAINGCGKCLESHEKTLRKKGVEPLVIQGAIRLASVIHAIAVTVEQDAASRV